MSNIIEELQEVKKASQAQTEASQNIADEVSGKMGEIDERVAQAEKEFDSLKNGIQNYIPLPSNLFSNSMMRGVETEGHPTGYSAVGCTIEAVHPHTRGFEGVYSSDKPDSASSTIEGAGEGKPFWFGSWDIGSRMEKGGLGGGWGGISDGKILKITSKAADEAKYFRIPAQSLGVFSVLNIKLWVKIVSGKFGVGRDSGSWSQSRGSNMLDNIIEKTKTDSAVDGWLLVDKRILIPQSVSIGRSITFGLPHDEDCEIYIALPYLYVPMAGKAMILAAGETESTPVFISGSSS